jgi:O-methyltransferase involved in polyketide biosynthesis
MTQPLSKHRHISFTAHYRLYLVSNGDLTSGLCHQKGQVFSCTGSPTGKLGREICRWQYAKYLKQRHTLLDDQLNTLIEQYPQLQVLEIASGLSPRGWWFRQHYPEITYRELDLPDMAQTKQAALQQIEANAPEMLSVDLFTAEFKQAFDLFDPRSSGGDQ